MLGQPAVTTFLFTDIEGSTRLWEQAPERMRGALAHHDAIARAAVEAHRGLLVKMTGDGVHAAFGDALDALGATLQLQQGLSADASSEHGVTLRVRCGLHAGSEERRDGDFFGPAVNRAARIMAAAHGGQVLLSQAVASQLEKRLPEGVALHDLGAVRLRDLASPERVYQLVHPRLRREFPALRSLEATPNNLPQQVSSFVGREHELAEARQLLGATRLLTLLGAGGLGKTRLQLQLAADALDDYPDGVWLVELAPLDDGARVAQAVALVLGVKETAGRSLLEVLARHAATRQMLILLDNCEHLAQDCAELAKALLASGARLKILVSSREPLHVSGESVYAVPALGQDPAVRLFAERARAARADFRVTDRNAPAIAEICRHLDGMPLAIELAAARVRALPVEGIAARLGDRFRLLTGGDRTALPRQQSLRALIDWSYELLAAPERTLLCRLSIFAGGWTLEAAETVGAAGEVRAEDVLGLLAQLVDKSLVAPEASGERYRMLETVRQYARERLEEAGEKKAARARHLTFYLALAEKAGPELIGPAQGAWLERLDAERENLIAAHRWCDRAADGAAMGYRLLDEIKLYWFMRGQLGLGLRLTQEALARPGAEARNSARCRGLFTAGQICSYAGRYDEAVGYLQESLAIALETGDERNQLAVLQPLTMASLGLGDTAAAREHAQQALALARRRGDKHQLAGALTAVAQLHRAENRMDAAQPLYEEVAVLAREIGDQENIAIGLLNLAIVATGRGSRAQARALLLEILAIAGAIGSTPAGQSALEVCAGLAASGSAWARAARFLGAAEAQADRSGLRRDPSDEAFLAPWMERARRALGEAAYGASEAAGRALGYAEALIEARAWLESGERLTD